MSPTPCLACGLIRPESREWCPRCCDRDAGSEIGEQRVARGSVDNTDERGIAIVNLPPEIAGIQRMAMWLILLSAFLTSYMVIHVSAGRTDSVSPEFTAMRPANQHEQRPVTVVDGQSSDSGSGQKPYVVR